MSEWILLLVLFAVPIGFFALYPAILRYERRRVDKQREDWLKNNKPHERI
jgi:hypothetical protein